MSPRLRQKLDWIENWMKTQVKSALESRYELGEQVLEIYLDETKHGAKVYGRNAIDNICKILKWDDGVIRACLRFVQLYTRKDLDRLCSLILPRGEPISWSHLRCLFQVPEPERREALLQQTVQEGWTCTELALAVKHLDDPRGRPVKIPPSFDGLAQQQLQFVETWEKRYPKIWASSEQSFTSRAGQLKPEEVTEDRLREAADLADRLRQMAKQVTQAAEKAEAVVSNFERILAERKAASPPATPSPAAQEPVESPSPKATASSAEKQKNNRASTGQKKTRASTSGKKPKRRDNQD
jgi:hypothetical protein